MTGWAPVRWLLGLEAIPSDAPVVRWAWERPPAPWAWVTILAAAAAVAWLSYRQVDVPRGAAKSTPVCCRQLRNIGCIRPPKPDETLENASGDRRNDFARFEPSAA